jgi:hypothetical protein
MTQDRIEKMLSAQAGIRAAYRRGQIDDALVQFNADIGPALETADPRISRLAHRLAKSLITMVDADLARASQNHDPGR